MASTDKWFLVCNPIARGGKMKNRWEEVKKALSKYEVPYDFSFTEANNHAIEITVQKIREGYRKFVVIGGDGTINEVVNGFFIQKTVDPKELTFALIPLGTANDWARSYKIPGNVDQAVQIIKNAKKLQQDVGLAEFENEGISKQRYFNNVAGLSYDAFVVKYMEDHGNKKMNKLKYIYYVLHCLFKFSLPEARVMYENKEIKGKVYTVNIGICKYSGGGLRLVPQAIPDDGKFALTVAKKLSKLQVILNMYRFYTGTIHKMKQVIAVNTGDIQVFQEGSAKVLLELDGEFMGYAPAKFTLIPDALNFVAP